MGVARYKSTGDMLAAAAAELAGDPKKKLDSEGEEEEQEVEDVGTSKKYYCDDANDETLSRRTPLLVRDKQRRRSRTVVEDDETHRFLGRKPKRPTEVEAEDNECSRWMSKHWRSAGDFLALNLQQQHLKSNKQQQQQQLEDNSKCLMKQQAEQAARSMAHKSHEYSLNQWDNNTSWPDWAIKSTDRRPRSPHMVVVATPTKLIGAGKWRANRIVRRRAAASSGHRRRDTDSLSLSSPAIAQRRSSTCQQRQDDGSGFLKAEGHDEPERQVKNSDEPGDWAAQQQQQRRRQRLQIVENGSLGKTFNVDAHGTMAAPMDQNYREHKLLHCLVDVAHLQQLKHNQSHHISSQPHLKPQPTNERSTGVGCCLGKTSNVDLGRQDNSSRSKQTLGHDQVHDNSSLAGYRLSGRGVGVDLAPAPATCNGEDTTHEAAGSGQAWWGSGSHECGQSATSACSVVVMLPKNSRQEKEEEQADNNNTKKPSTDYAPTQWQWQRQQVAASSAQATKQQPPAKGNGFHLIELEQAESPLDRQNATVVASSGTNGQVVAAATNREKLSTTVGHSGRNLFVDHYSNISTANSTRGGLSMGSLGVGQSWRHALQANKSGSYKVAKSQLQQQVAPISGTNLIAAATATPTLGTISSSTIEESLQQQEEQLQLQQETAAAATGGNNIGCHQAQQSIFNNNNNLDGAGGNHEQQQQHKIKLVPITRHSRPGRSPITLQKLTNTRLARHRLKIQQQRQDQLAQLALRERLPNFINHHNQYLNHYQLDHHHHDQQQQGWGPSNARRDTQHHHQISGGHESGGAGSFLVNSLRDRFTPLQTTANQHDSRGQRFSIQRYNRSQGETSVIIPNTTRTTIEICDNQLASSSSSSSDDREVRLQNQYQGPITTSTTGNQRLSGNVIVYKSINMLRNTSLDTSLYGRNNSISGDGRRPYSHELVENSDKIESDPETSTISSEGSNLDPNRPFCKVCHTGSTKHGDKLISPCRCSGTMQYIHCGCLLKWLEISNRSNEKPMSCELCAHEYTWHKKFNYKQMRLPKCSMKDALLHIIFVAAMGVMLFSAITPMLQSKSHDTTSPPGLALKTQPASSMRVDQSSSRQEPKISSPISSSSSNLYATTSTSSHRTKHSTGHLAQDEKFMLLCAASFFMSFFLAIYVQTKARDTLYGLVVKFLTMNQTYYITEYDHGQFNNNSGQNANGCSKQQYVEDGRKYSGQKS